MSKQPHFRAFTIAYPTLVPRILTPAHIAPAFDPAQVNPNTCAHLPITVLWDTGATNSVIVTSLAQRLQLTPIGRSSVNHAGGHSEVYTYLVNFVLPNQVGVPGILVSACPDNAGDFDAILGMDIISQGDFSITNVNQQTCMTFRTPSIEIVDYVAVARQIKFAGTPRNAPCPCGKQGADGKPLKFKECHGRLAVQPGRR